MSRTIFTRPKQKNPRQVMYNVIYNIPCLGNGREEATCDLSYLGTTRHKVGSRYDQHEEDLITFNRINDLGNATALVHHFYNTGHAPNQDKATIIDVEHAYTKRKVLQSLHILTQPSTTNFRRDTDNI